jgi:hypothetical protein
MVQTRIIWYLLFFFIFLEKSLERINGDNKNKRDRMEATKILTAEPHTDTDQEKWLKIRPKLNGTLKRGLTDKKKNPNKD